MWSSAHTDPRTCLLDQLAWLPVALTVLPGIGSLDTHTLCNGWSRAPRCLLLPVAFAGDTFTGGVYFLRVPPKPAGEAAGAATAAAMDVQRQLLRLLQYAERGEKATAPSELRAELAGVFALDTAKRLLVLDGVWDKCILEEVRCQAMKGVILLTSRSSVCGSARHTVQLQPDDSSRQTASELMSELLAAATYREQVRQRLCVCLQTAHVCCYQPRHCLVTKVASGQDVTSCSAPLSCMQSIIDSITKKCDGHLLAVDILGKALRRYKTAEGWQDVAQKFHANLQKGASQEEHVVFSALQAALDSLRTAADREGREAIRAFVMLRHVQASRLLPVPMLQLLCSWVYPEEPIPEVEALLDRLVQASLLYKQVRSDTRL